ncbi:MAG: RimK family alpha-L-glutamate ligase [Myxococcota bacterium]
MGSPAKTVVILSHSESFYSTRRLMEACAAQGLVATRVDPVAASLEPRRGGTGLRVDGRELETPDLLIPRVGARLTGWGMALVQALVDAGATSAASAAAIGQAQDKLATTQRLVAAGVPTVPTLAIREPVHADQALDTIGGAPVVVKLREGSGGEQVHLARDSASAKALLERLTAQHATVLVQPFIEAKPARDLRVLIIGGQAIAACWRYASDGEFRANVHRGGRVECATLTDEVREVAQAAARALSLPVCGVDLMPHPAGFPVLEVNASPGLQGIEAATGRDLAGQLVAWLRSVRRDAPPLD